MSHKNYSLALMFSIGVNLTLLARLGKLSEFTASMTFLLIAGVIVGYEGTKDVTPLSDFAVALAAVTRSIAETPPATSNPRICVGPLTPQFMTLVAAPPPG